MYSKCNNTLVHDSMVLIEEKNVLVTGSEDSSARLWTLEGHSIGIYLTMNVIIINVL